MHKYLVLAVILYNLSQITLNNNHKDYCASTGCVTIRPQMPMVYKILLSEHEFPCLKEYSGHTAPAVTDKHHTLLQGIQLCKKKH